MSEIRLRDLDELLHDAFGHRAVALSDRYEDIERERDRRRIRREAGQAAGKSGSYSVSRGTRPEASMPEAESGWTDPSPAPRPCNNGCQ